MAKRRSRVDEQQAVAALPAGSGPITVAELAHALGLLYSWPPSRSNARVRKAIERGAIGAVRVLGTVHIPRDEAVRVLQGDPL